MNIQFKNNRPLFEETFLDDIIGSQDTPFYIYSQKIIENTYKKLEMALKTDIFFSVKANSNQAILKLMKNCGAGADVVSAGELQRSISAGFNPNKIIFEGVGKSKQDIEYAIKENIRLINIESFNEINLVNEIAKNLGMFINVGIRLNPDIDGNTLDKISTGKKTDKFGINIDEIDNIISLIQSLKHINFISISCHIGSQINDIKIFEKVFLKMKKTASHLLSVGIKLEHVDLGGGFAVNYEKNYNDLDIDKIGKLVTSIFNETPYKISFEPGRYLIAKAGIIITKILTSKKNGGINFLVADAGMNTLIRPAMYGASHRIEALNDLNRKKEIYTIAGPICESTDIIAKNIFLPKQNIGNFLAIHDVGAYGAVMSSNYNSRGLPSEILVNKNNYAIIRKEVKILETIQRDIIPEWL
jgi:diaminopimelate decarboxylase